MISGKPQYAHEGGEWPNYRWNHEIFSERIASIHFRRGALLTAMATLGFEVRQETVLQVLVEDVTKSSAIEGDNLNAAMVRSSIARRLGIDFAGLPQADRHTDGVVEMMLDATQHYEKALTEGRILGWHSSLFPSGWSGLHKISVGNWRDDAEGPMQVVSGPLGKETVHFEAPSAARLPWEMKRFLHWFETEQIDPLLKAAVAHIWFVTVHPLDDGNGRIGRAIMDLSLARADQTSQRFYSMSAQICKDRDSYYKILEGSQKSSMDITPWILWFLDRMDGALKAAEGVLEIVKRKQAFWDTHSFEDLNERQIKIINMLQEGFNGKLQTAKYAKIAKCSESTALRDLNELVEKNILILAPGSGRSTSYDLA